MRQVFHVEGEPRKGNVLTVKTWYLYATHTQVLMSMDVLFYSTNILSYVFLIYMLYMQILNDLKERMRGRFMHLSTNTRVAVWHCDQLTWTWHLVDTLAPRKPSDLVPHPPSMFTTYTHLAHSLVALHYDKKSLMPLPFARDKPRIVKNTPFVRMPWQHRKRTSWSPFITTPPMTAEVGVSTTTILSMKPGRWMSIRFLLAMKQWT